MLKKLLSVGILFSLLTTMSAGISAEEVTGKINCWLQWGEESSKEGSLEICQVGDSVPEGYRLKQEFGGGIIAGEEIPSEAFALWISKKAGKGMEHEPDRNGLVCFDDLKPGIYLIRQGRESKIFLPIAPYLACVSQELSVIDTYPVILPRSSIPRTGQYSEVYFGTLGIAVALTGIFIYFWVKSEKEAKL